MLIQRNDFRKYAYLAAACVVGYAWLIWEYRRTHVDGAGGVCLIKHVTGIPCPSCGSTRSVQALLHGDVANALWLNPLGIVLFVLLILLPLWMAFDKISGRRSLAAAYDTMENVLRKPLPAVIFALLIAINWVWNITKGV